MGVAEIGLTMTALGECWLVPLLGRSEKSANVRLRALCRSSRRGWAAPRLPGIESSSKTSLRVATSGGCSGVRAEGLVPESGRSLARSTRCGRWHFREADVGTHPTPGPASLCLKFLLQLIKKPKVGALINDLLRTGLDRPNVMQPHRPEAH